MAQSFNTKKFVLNSALIPLAIALSGCSLASLPANYSPIEKQTVEELSGSNFVPRSEEEREAIATQDMFAQTAFWSKEYDLNPADLEAAINLSANLRKLGNPGKSIEVAQHTRALYPRDVDLMTELGASYIANNQATEAIKIIDSALYQRPRSARLWSLKGAGLDQMERFGEARKNYTKALGFAPNDPSILANVGLSYALEGDPKTAEIWLRRAASLPDANPNVRQNLALVLGLQGKLDEAERWAKQDLDQAGASNNLDYIRSLRGASSPTSNQTTPSASIPAPTSRKTSRVYGQTAPRIPVQKASTAPQRLQSTAQRSAPPAPARPAPQNAQPAPFGAKIAVAGDPATMKNGPQTVSEAAMAVLRQRNAALRNMPSQPQTAPQLSQRTAPPQNAPQAAAPGNVLGKISQNNTPKALLARQQQAQLAQRAAYMAQQRQQQMYAYPPQPGAMPPGYNPAQQNPYAQQPYAPQQQQQYAPQQYAPQQQLPLNRPPARDRRR